jgi:signal transduction histidine kinase
MRSYARSSSFKMALLFTVLLGLATAALSYVGYYFSRDSFIDNAETVIASEIKYLALLDRQGQLRTTLGSLSVANRSSHQPFQYLLQTADERYIAGSLHSLPQQVNILKEGTITFDDDQTNRLYAARFHLFADGRKLLVAYDITRVSQHYTMLKWLSITAIFLMALVILTSYFISTFVVSRTNQIAATAQDIVRTGDLSRRINLSSRWDDLGFMAGVLNVFLERNEQQVNAIKQVSDNIAHDLRTPLTRLHSSLEQLHSTAPTNQQEQIAQLLKETDLLLSTFAALLRISRLEASAAAISLQPVALEQVAQDVLELYEPVAELKNIRLTHGLASTLVMGDRDLIFQMLANLLDNAIKFTPEHGHISLNTEVTAGLPTLTLIDSGPGIAPELQDKVFERFYRVDSARSQNTGSGLGLSLVKAAAQQMGIKITLSPAQADNPSTGLSVMLQFMPGSPNVTNL